MYKTSQDPYSIIHFIFKSLKNMISFLVHLEKQKLSQDSVGLVKSLGGHPLAEYLSNASEFTDLLLSHGLSHKVSMLL